MIPFDRDVRGRSSRRSSSTRCSSDALGATARLGGRELPLRPQGAGRRRAAARRRRASRRASCRCWRSTARSSPPATSAASSWAARSSTRARCSARRSRCAGEVVHGDKRGRELGFRPRTSCPPDGFARPGHGVYAAPRPTARARTGPAAVNVGVRPMFETGRGELIEAYLLDFDGDLYGTRAARSSSSSGCAARSASPGVDALIEQMGRDVETTRAIVPAAAERRTAGCYRSPPHDAVTAENASRRSSPSSATDEQDTGQHPRPGRAAHRAHQRAHRAPARAQKDHHSRRGLLMLVGQPPPAAELPPAHDLEGYRALVRELGLRRVSVRATAPGTPVAGVHASRREDGGGLHARGPAGPHDGPRLLPVRLQPGLHRPVPGLPGGARRDRGRGAPSSTASRATPDRRRRRAFREHARRHDPAALGLRAQGRGGARASAPTSSPRGMPTARSSSSAPTASCAWSCEADAPGRSCPAPTSSSTASPRRRRADRRSARAVGGGEDRARRRGDSGLAGSRRSTLRSDAASVWRCDKCTTSIACGGVAPGAYPGDGTRQRAILDPFGRSVRRDTRTRSGGGFASPRAIRDRLRRAALRVALEPSVTDLTSAARSRALRDDDHVRGERARRSSSSTRDFTCPRCALAAERLRDAPVAHVLPPLRAAREPPPARCRWPTPPRRPRARARSGRCTTRSTPTRAASTTRTCGRAPSSSASTSSASTPTGRADDAGSRRRASALGSRRSRAGVASRRRRSMTSPSAAHEPYALWAPLRYAERPSSLRWTRSDTENKH